jgi:hypothetical protein
MTFLTFRFPLRCFLPAARGLLAMRAKIAASARHNHTADQRLAPRATFSFSSVHAMVPLIFSRLAIRVKKVRDRRPSQHDRLLQNVLECPVQLFHLCWSQPCSQMCRMDFRFPQALVPINVSHAAQHPLIQQQRLHTRSPVHALLKFF